MRLGGHDGIDCGQKRWSEPKQKWGNPRAEIQSALTQTGAGPEDAGGTRCRAGQKASPTRAAGAAEAKPVERRSKNRSVDRIGLGKRQPGGRELPAARGIIFINTQAQASQSLGAGQRRAPGRGHASEERKTLPFLYQNWPFFLRSSFPAPGAEDSAKPPKGAPKLDTAAD